MPIRRLPETLINRIAAGEVIERPASVVKELVENSLDAGARRIDVVVRDGGATEVVVDDDGCGMGPDDLALAVERHATSKLASDEDLLSIRTLGFRGEALPSIAAVSRLKVTSRAPDADTGWRLGVEGGRHEPMQPAARERGTRIEVRDLFFATPARLKFLKAPATELAHAVQVVERLAIAHPGTAFTLSTGERTLRALPAGQGDPDAMRQDRVRRVLGEDFAANAVVLEAERHGVRLTGLASLPTLHRRTNAQQLLFVNGRPVRDRLLHGAIRGGYHDRLAADRHPIVVLLLDVPGDDLDVNVHPMKTEVRFREPQLIRGLIVGTLRQSLGEGGPRTASTVAAPLLEAAAAKHPAPWQWQRRQPALPLRPGKAGGNAGGLSETAAAFIDREAEEAALTGQAEGGPLGAARAQVHGTFIISQTADGIVIVDQHAAHERLVHEKLKAALAGGGVPRQCLLIPEVVELDDHSATQLVARGAELAELGLIVERFGQGGVVVREVPTLLASTDIRALINDLAEEIVHLDAAAALPERLSRVCATIACHGSVRAGRRLSIEEMNALLRQMEGSAEASQCSHGRPTFVEFKLADLERMFGRR